MDEEKHSVYGLVLAENVMAWQLLAMGMANILSI